ncbi:MAG: O-antigen ligase family protein [Bacteroidetes bacterium]|nr:O-antigen ligase family protein [Bacteroidota bacterium]
MGQFYSHSSNPKVKIALAIFSIALSNVTFATYSVFNVIFALLAAHYYLSNIGKLDTLFFCIVLLLLFIGLGQTFVFQTYNLYNFGGIFLIFLIPYFAYKTIGLGYFQYFVKIIYVLAFISLFFWAAINIWPGFGTVLQSVSRALRLDPGSNESVIVYNVELGKSSLGFIKNSGFTAEGGLFCTFLIPALYLNNIRNFKLWTKINIVLILAIITTSSTAGYAALLIFLLFAVLNMKSKVVAIILLPLIIVMGIYVVKELPFMFDKVNKSYTDEMNVYNSTKNPARKGRFLGARVDLDIIKDNPLTGRGIYNEVRYLNEEEREIGYSNSYLGIVGLASRYGLILWFFYMYLLLKFLYRYYALMNQGKLNSNRLYPLFFFLSIFAIAMGQNPFYSVVYLTMVYAGFDLITKKVTVRANKNIKSLG